MKRKKEMKRANLGLGFPGGSVVKNLPANAGDIGLILGLGKDPTCHRQRVP